MVNSEIDNPQSPIRNQATGDLAQRLHRELQTHSDRPLTAIVLAESLGIGGSHETRRRAVRALVEKLHGSGFCVCADCHPTEGGYWLARSDGEWHGYKEACKKRARFGFVRLWRMATAARERRDKQQRLFVDGGTLQAGW